MESPASVRKVLFLDCDDTLYFNDWATAGQLTESINSYCVDRLGLASGRPYELYKQWGTCLRGLQAEQVPGFEPEEFLHTVHARLSIEQQIGPDLRLQAVLARLRPVSQLAVRVFTASCAEHAGRCMAALGVRELLEAGGPVIDVRTVGFRTKHDPESFEIARRAAVGEREALCILVDDSWSNMRAAKAAGWTTVLCGASSRDGRPAGECEHADFRIDSIHGLPQVLPELFLPE